MVDARGYLCPMPVVMVQNAIKKTSLPHWRYWSITKLLSKTSNVSPHTAATRLRPAKTAMITA